MVYFSDRFSRYAWKTFNGLATVLIRHDDRLSCASWMVCEWMLSFFCLTLAESMNIIVALRNETEKGYEYETENQRIRGFPAQYWRKWLIQNLSGRAFRGSGQAGRKLPVCLDFLSTDPYGNRICNVCQGNEPARNGGNSQLAVRLKTALGACEFSRRVERHPESLVTGFPILFRVHKGASVT